MLLEVPSRFSSASDVAHPVQEMGSKAITEGKILLKSKPASHQVPKP